MAPRPTLIVLALAATALAAVIEVDASNYERLTANSAEPLFMMFYAPYCGWCKRLHPDFAAAANKLAGIARFGAVDCTAPANQPLCARNRVEGYPTLALFNSETSSSSTSGGRGAAPVPYNGERDAEALARWAMRHVRSHIARGDAAHVANAIADAGGDNADVLVLASRSDKPSLTSVAVAREFVRGRGASQARVVGVFGDDELTPPPADVAAALTPAQRDALTALLTRGGAAVFPAHGDPLVFDGAVTRKELFRWVRSTEPRE